VREDTEKQSTICRDRGKEREKERDLDIIKKERERVIPECMREKQTARGK
jgi:hypothetical protein